MRRDESNVALLRESYRFLAPRFMPVVEWVRVLDAASTRKRVKSVVMWK
jgi:hypothetical protein